MDKKPSFTRVIWGIVLVILGVVIKVTDWSILTYFRFDISQSIASETGNLICSVMFIVIGMCLVVSYFGSNIDK